MNKSKAATASKHVWAAGRPGNFFRGVMLLMWGTLLCVPGIAQPVDFTYPSWGLEVDSDNVIQNAAHLDRFFEKLHRLKSVNDGTVSIVHIGDSHLQADYMTSIIRRNFHRHFGNAGRGLIVPLRVAGTNEPVNFKTVSDFQWQSKRCVFPQQPMPVGIGGVTIKTQEPRASLQVFMNDLWLDYSFNTLTLFYEKDERSYDVALQDMSGNELGTIAYHPDDSAANYARVSWDSSVDAVRLQLRKSAPEQSRAILYGMVLGNSANGVLYHTIGVNGAKFKHYNAAQRFAGQTTVLAPDLIIVSLGTNESNDYPFVDNALSAQIAELMTSLKSCNPEAAFLLVTPQDVFRLRNKPNHGILEVRQEIIRYAVENGLAFYDMYKAMGGASSAAGWRAEGLLSRDGIHLTREGYEYQGNLFYHALMKSYNSYVPAGHP